MKRYNFSTKTIRIDDLTTNFCGLEVAIGPMTESPEGKYVLYDDAKDAMELAVKTAKAGTLDDKIAIMVEQQIKELTKR